MLHINLIFNLRLLKGYKILVKDHFLASRKQCLAHKKWVFVSVFFFCLFGFCLCLFLEELKSKLKN